MTRRCGLTGNDQPLAVGLALGSAVLLAIGATIQQRAASRTHGHGRRVDPALLARLVRQPLWLIGFALTLAHFSLQATALAKGRLVVVEPILSTGLLLALPLSAALGRTRLRRLDWVAAVAAATGLAGFLVLAAPSTGRDTVSTSTLTALALPIEAVGILVAALASRYTGRMLPLALGCAAGVLSAATDACTKTVAQVAGSAHLGVLADPRLLLLAVVGLTSFTLQQNAYRSAGLAASLPALVVLQPTTGALLGVLVYGETLRAAPAYLVGEVLAALVAVWGIVTLARSPLVEVVMRGAPEREAAETDEEKRLATSVILEPAPEADLGG